MGLLHRLGVGDRVEREFRQLNPWITKFTIKGRAYGGWFDAMNDGRLEEFRGSFPNARRILELGSLEGGHSMALASRAGVEVVALEGRTENIRRAEMVKNLLSAKNVTFVHANLEEPDVLRRFGYFDAAYCCGLLYHLPKPWELLGQIAGVTEGLFLSTHYCPAEKATIEQNGYAGCWYTEGGLEEPLSGLCAKSFWPTIEGLRSMLERAGFDRVQVLETNEGHQHGPLVDLAAFKA